MPIPRDSKKRLSRYIELRITAWPLYKIWRNKLQPFKFSAFWVAKDLQARWGFTQTLPAPTDSFVTRFLVDVDSTKCVPIPRQPISCETYSLRSFRPKISSWTVGWQILNLSLLTFLKFTNFYLARVRAIFPTTPVHPISYREPDNLQFRYASGF